MDTTLLKLMIILLFGVIVGGGVYLVLFVVEWRQTRSNQVAELELGGTLTPDDEHD